MASPINDHDVGRRALLTTAGLVIPAMLATAACSREAGDHDRGGEHKEGGEEEVTANEDLMREHGVLRRVLIVYREAGPLIASGARIDVGALNQAAALFRAFGEQYHEKMLEEAYVFPAVQKAGVPRPSYPPSSLPSTSGAVRSPTTSSIRPRRGPSQPARRQLWRRR